VSALPIANTDHAMTECSTLGSLGDFLGFKNLLYSGTEGKSRYIIACDQFYQAFLYIITASNKCWGREGLGMRISLINIVANKYAVDKSSMHDILGHTSDLDKGSLSLLVFNSCSFPMHSKYKVLNLAKL